jgi:aryl carrier-like protein
MSVFFILSTGRCGTQWLYKTLSQSLSGNFQVTHEPLHFEYAPISNSPANPLKKNSELLLKHLDNIRQYINDDENYLECGFPSWRHLGWFYEQLPVDLKIIYLHRDPTDTAISWLKQNAFVPPILPHIAEKELFHPTSDGAKLPEYASLWPALTPFEKNLYYWAEVQLQAEEYKQQWSPENWMTIRFDTLFNHMTINNILKFMHSESKVESINTVAVDEFSGMPQTSYDRKLISRHPTILAIARNLSYAYT